MKPNIVRNLQFLGRMRTRAIQDNQCVNNLPKFGTNLLQVKVYWFGVRLVANMVDDAASVRANGTRLVAVSIALFLNHRRSSILLGPYATQHRALYTVRLA